MRVSVGVVVLALLGRAAGFAGIATRAHTARLRHQNAFELAKPSSHPAPVRHHHPSSWPQIATTAIRGGGRVLKASDQPAAGSSSRPPLDVKAVGKYIAGTAVEFGIIMGLLTLLQGNVLARLGAKWARATVFLTFGFLAMKSRTFAVLNARRPAVAKEKEAKVERRRPDWMPPPKVFPFIWITIGILRAVSTTMVWEALGCNLATGPIAAMVLHLSIGDTWNHINNVEKKLGVAVSVVFVVWLSVANAVFRYYQALPKAGLVLLPSLLWITVANLLVQAIWRLNGKEPLYPPKQTT